MESGPGKESAGIGTGGGHEGDVLPQMALVADRHTTRTIDTLYVLVEQQHFYNNACFVPLRRVWTHSILEPNAVADRERGKNLCVLGQTFVCAHVSVSNSLLAISKSFPPSSVGSAPPRMDGYTITNGAADRRRGAWTGDGCPDLDSGVFRYCSMARCKWSVFSSPVMKVLSQSRTFANLTATSAPVAVKECDGHHTVLNAPVSEERLSHAGGEFRSAI